ncbi:MAG: hypothetical protein ABEH43_03635, partial [Flavobacteriales bacterium]
MNLNEVLDLEVFENKEVEEISFAENSYDFYKTERYLDNGDRPFARYFFVDARDGLIGHFIENGFEAFEHFQSELFLDEFFSHQTDLRLNLYLFLISDKTDNPICEKITQNTEYCRKYVLNL